MKTFANLAVLAAMLFPVGSLASFLTRPSLDEDDGCFMLQVWNPIGGGATYGGCEAEDCNFCYEVPVGDYETLCSCNSPGGGPECDGVLFAPPLLPHVIRCEGACPDELVCRRQLPLVGFPITPNRACKCQAPE